MSYTDHSNYLKDSMKTDGELHMKMKARTSCKYMTWTEKKKKTAQLKLYKLSQGRDQMFFCC